jgi:hypothetical protein
MNDDDLTRDLGALPVRDLERTRAERLRCVALGVLAAERRLATRPALRAATHLWDRVLEPALVAGTTGVYLVWAFQKVLALYQ